jgi:hypothetical protein
MKEIIVDLKYGSPKHLLSWAESNNITRPTFWATAIEMFNKTTNGEMVGNKGDTQFKLVFENEHDYIMYILRYL